jgi:hypothetical protein
VAEEGSIIANDSKEERCKTDYDPQVHNEDPGTRVFIKFGNEKSELVDKIDVQLSKFVKLTYKHDVALNSEDMILFSTIKRVHQS